MASKILIKTIRVRVETESGGWIRIVGVAVPGGSVANAVYQDPPGNTILQAIDVSEVSFFVEVEASFPLVVVAGVEATLPLVGSIYTGSVPVTLSASGNVEARVTTPDGLAGAKDTVAIVIDLLAVPLAIINATATMEAEGALAAAPEFPLTAAELAAELGLPGALATEIWSCQETSVALTGELLGEVLTATLPTDDPTMGDPSAWVGWNSVGFENNSDERFIGVDTTILSGSDQSKAFLCVFKVIDISVNHGLLVTKRGADANTGFDLAILSNGTLFAQLGTAAANNGVVDDDVWMAAVAIHDRTNNFVRLVTNRAPTVVSTAKVQDSTNTAPLIIGRGSVFKVPHAQVAYVAAFEGAAAEAFTAAGAKAALDAFWALHTP